MQTFEKIISYYCLIAWLFCKTWYQLLGGGLINLDEMFPSRIFQFSRIFSEVEYFPLYLARRDGCPVCRVWCVECEASATVQSLIRLLVGGQCPLSQVVTGPPLHHLHQTDTPHMYLLPNVTWIINIHFLPHTSVWNLCTELFCFWATFDNVADAAGEIFLSI